MISGKTQNLAVIGCPIAHSLSPAMQNAAIKAADVDYIYIALKILPENLAVAVKGLTAANFRGFNVTIPHKQAIMSMLDDVAADAQNIGAVNTVVNDGGRLTGYNTDAQGFWSPLAAWGFAPRNAVILGAGGAARAVLYALLTNKTQNVTVGARNATKAANLAAGFSKLGNVVGGEWHGDNFAAAIKEADLIVNATPLGMTGDLNAMPPVDWSIAKADAIAYDLIYTPAVTEFLRTAKEHGHRTLNGEAMLAAQGAASFKLWTGQQADTRIMEKVLRDELAAKRN